MEGRVVVVGVKARGRGAEKAEKGRGGCRRKDSHKTNDFLPLRVVCFKTGQRMVRCPT